MAYSFGSPKRRIRATSAFARLELLEERALLAAVAWENVWQSAAVPSSRQNGVLTSYLRASEFEAYTLDASLLSTALADAPLETFGQVQRPAIEISLADPSGQLQRFNVFESPIMDPQLAALFPDIKTYAGQGIDNPAATVRFDVTPAGFHAQVLSPTGRWYIDPYYHLSSSLYASYNGSAADQMPEFHEHHDEMPGSVAQTYARDTSTLPQAPGSAVGSNAGVAGRTGTQLRTYRTAVAASAEYTAFHGGTVALGQAAIVTAMNRVTGIYETELSIRLTLVGNNSLLVYTNAATDPYTNDDPGALLDENQANIDTVIGSANYDIGHVFTTGGGGLAGLGVVGINGQKALGETGLGSPIGDAFYVDYVAHEMGHQFGGNHTFNGDSGSCSGGNRNGSTAYEPGSGTTIQAYAGICGNDDLAPHSDAYFHSVSLDEMLQHVDVVIPNVGTRTATGNAVPTVNAGLDFTIPTGTPFILSATGADGDGTASLTYSWDQRDLGPQADVNAADNGSSPLFRFMPPTSTASRTFPRLSDLVNNTTVIGEKLPTVARAMDFRVTVRDNRAGGGGVNTDDMVVNVVNTGAVFAVTSPNTAVTWAGASSQTVTWNVAGTTGNGINAANVRILLSTDGGLTFPTIVSASEANDGSATITVPNPAVTTTTARIKVEAIGNIFFDISNVNFTITHVNVGNSPPVVNNQSFSVAENSAASTAVGTVLASDPDLGQTLTYAITAGNTGGAFAINPTTGAITVASSAAINFEVTPNFALTVQVTDSGSPALSDTATITVNLTNANEAPVVSNQSFSTVENRTVGAAIGTVAASDPDVGQPRTFSITGGNAGGAFAINATSGVITVANAALLNFEVNPSFALTVQVADNGSPSLSDTATITINVTNVNESPVVSDQTLSVAGTAVNGASVGTVLATDPDAGQSISFVIGSGNTGGAFAINASTGAITVANSAALAGVSSFVLTVQVSDTGSPVLTVNPVITINVTGGTTQLLDDGDTGYTFVGTWANGSGGYAGANGIADAKYVAGDAVADRFARASFVGLTAGQYRVSATYRVGTTNATNATYSMFSSVGGAFFGSGVLNQTLAPNDVTFGGKGFEHIGVIDVTGTTLLVQLADTGNGRIWADAIRIERIGGLTNGPNISVFDGAVVVADNTGLVNFGLTGPGQAVTKTFTIRNLGNQNLVLQPLAAVGTGFSIITNLSAGQVVAPGGQATFSVRLTATTEGTFNGSVSFVTNDTGHNRNPYNFAVTGRVANIRYLDDGDAGFTTTGVWANSSGGRGGDTKYAEGAGSATKLAHWQLTGLTAGTYRAYVSWRVTTANASNATYRLRQTIGGSALLTATESQLIAPDDLVDDGTNWELLGQVAITGTQLVVELSNLANGRVFADAVRIERVGSRPSADSPWLVEQKASDIWG